VQIILRNHGLIYPTRGNLPESFSFAQSPQILNVENIRRVYFSSRTMDNTGKPVSCVNYVDFSSDFEEIIGSSIGSVVERGALGTFDEHGIFPFHPKVLNGKVYAFSTGWSRRVSVSIETAIGLLKGNSRGTKFQRVGDGPLLGASLTEPFLVGDAFVVEGRNGNFFMYYIAGVKWKVDSQKSSQPERIYKIHMAISSDLVNWERLNRNLISDVLGDDECQALPSVISSRDGFLMAFCYREAFKFRDDTRMAYRLGFAISKDGLEWVRADEKFSILPHVTGWDRDMRCYPHLFMIDDRIAILYNGNKFGEDGFGLAIQESEPKLF
jgi:hypothetical protein